jgi:hypothetical protein
MTPTNTRTKLNKLPTAERPSLTELPKQEPWPSWMKQEQHTLPLEKPLSSINLLLTSTLTQ